MIKGLIFDMDGLLVDTEKLYNRFWREAAKEFGYDMTYEDALGIRSLNREYASEKLKKRFGEEFSYIEVRERRRELMRDFVDKEGVEIKPGVKELLEYAEVHGYKNAVATASPYERAEKYLMPLGIFEYFDAVVGGPDVTVGKPEPDIYLAAADKLGFLPEECMAFEDSPNGIFSAYRAGCKAVMVPDLDEPEEEIQKLLTACVRPISEIIPILEADGSRGKK